MRYAFAWLWQRDQIIFLCHRGAYCPVSPVKFTIWIKTRLLFLSTQQKYGSGLGRDLCSSCPAGLVWSRLVNAQPADNACMLRAVGSSGWTVGWRASVKLRGGLGPGSRGVRCAARASPRPQHRAWPRPHLPSPRRRGRYPAGPAVSLAAVKPLGSA